MPPLFHCCHMNRQYLRKKTQIEKFQLQSEKKLTCEFSILFGVTRRELYKITRIAIRGHI